MRKARDSRFSCQGNDNKERAGNFWKSEHRKRGYEEIKTPLILNEHLWRTSGHWDHYKDNMYFTKIDGEDYA